MTRSVSAASTPAMSWQQITWPAQLSDDAALGLLRRLAADRRAPGIVLEARADKAGVRYLVGCSHAYRQVVHRRIEQMVPGSLVIDCDGERGSVVTARRIRLTDRSRAVHAVDPVATTRAVLSALTSVRGGELLVIQIVLGPRRSPRALPGLGLPARQSLINKVLHGIAPERNSDRRAAIKAKLGQHGFALTMRLGVAANTSERHQSLLLGLLGALSTAEAPDVQVEITAEQPRGINEARSP